MDAWISTLFEISGMAILTHLILCIVLQWRLRNQEEAARELFAVPNAWLSKGVGLRLLRARYYWPWTKFTTINELQIRDKIILSIARATGLIVPLALLGFLAMSVIQACIDSSS